MLTNVKCLPWINGVGSAPLSIGTPIRLDTVSMISTGSQFVASPGHSNDTINAGGFNFQFAYGDLVKIKQGRLFSNLASGLVPYFLSLSGVTNAAGVGSFRAILSNQYPGTPPDGNDFPDFSLSQNIGEWTDLDVELQQDTDAMSSSAFAFFFYPTADLRFKTDLIDSRLDGINYYIGVEFLIEHSQPIIWS